MIRRGEARAATRYCGVPAEQLHFLDMPFYETGKVRKKPLGRRGHHASPLICCAKFSRIRFTWRAICPIRTARIALVWQAVLQGLCGNCQDDDWQADCQVWLYRGAWQEWGPEQIEMAVPLSPQELMRKRVAIFKHQSQKDKALFPGPRSARVLATRRRSQPRDGQALRPTRTR